MQPTLEKVKELRSGGNVIPIYKSVIADFLTPVSAFLRIERDRQGAVRVFPGPNLASRPAPRFQEPVDLDETIDVEVPQQAVQDAPPEEAVEEVIETPIIEPEVVPEPVEAEETIVAEAEAVVEEKPKRTRARKTTGTRSTKTAKPRARKSARAN